MDFWLAKFWKLYLHYEIYSQWRFHILPFCKLTLIIHTQVLQYLFNIKHSSFPQVSDMHSFSSPQMQNDLVKGKYCPKETTYIEDIQQEGFYKTIINLQGINITPPYLQHNWEPLSIFEPRPNVVCTLCNDFTDH